MSGVVKAVGKAFKAVVKFVKKALPYIVMAAAIYFTAGLALSAMPATAGFAASLPGFAGGGFLGLGVGAGATAGTGIFTHAASAMGLATLGSSGGLVGGAMAAGTSAAALGAAGVSQAAISVGAAEAGVTGAVGAGAGAAGAAAAGAGGAAGSAGAGVATGGAAGGSVAGGAGAAVAKAGMTIGEKLLLASTGTSAIGALMSPKPADPNKYRGAFYGMDKHGKGGAIVPGAVEGAEGSAPAAASVAAVSDRTDQPEPDAPVATQNPDQQGLFAQGQQLGTATPTRQGSRFDVGQSNDLFQPMSGVRYVR